jgi:hypothetical protein
VKRTKEFLKRSRAAKKAWETRRAKARELELQAKKRSLAAKKGWKTRRAQAAYEEAERRAIREEAKAAERSARARKAALARWEKHDERCRDELAKQGLSPEAQNLWCDRSRSKELRDLDYARRLLLFDPANRLNGYTKTGLTTLNEMLNEQDERWLAFLKRAEHLQFSPREARTAFFSPKVGAPK